MIRISRNDTKLVVHLEHGLLGNGGSIILDWDAGRDIHADALVNHIQKELANRIEAIRRLEYEAGWKDAKGKKRPKRTWFRSTMVKAAP